MRPAWSRVEVEAIVAEYVAMLKLELRGNPYNKAGRNRALAGLLSNRSHGSIERKHQNISAVLIRCGYPYIPGYKPLYNYQSLLFDTVSAQIERDVELSGVIQISADLPPPDRAFSDILERLEAPPEPARTPAWQLSEYGRSVLRVPRPGVDYVSREARNVSLGRAGEEFVLNYERARLREAGRHSLADRVEHIAATAGDGVGFDVRSFESNGRDRLIEVKTTAHGKSTPFYVTRNEIAVSIARRDSYSLYRVFGFRTDPRLYTLPGSIESNFKTTAVQFEARVGGPVFHD